VTLPVVIDPRRLSVVLVGRGDAAARRVAWLDDAGVADLRVFSDAPGSALESAAAGRLARFLPASDDLPRRGLVLVAGLDDAPARAVAAAARDAGAWVHVEDRPALCDVHMPAVVRRGDLVVAVSTGGRSPATAARVRQMIERLLPRDWAARLDRVAALRRRLRGAGAAPRAVAAASNALIDAELRVSPARAA
jgi:precorrin-2 dehydrogenase/sirohydrochlorin ferrochelatase